MLVSMKAILEDANTNYYGVMAMNSINIEMARAGIMAAEEEHSPIIIQFGPGQMKNHAHMEEMLPVVEELAKRVHVPVALNLDHGSDFYVIADCINAGFTNVMFDGSSLPYEENVKRTAIVSALAHGMGCSVEGELGHVGQAADADDDNLDLYTDPDQAMDFVTRTGVDALAVAIGTAHGAYPKGKIPKLDFERLRLLKETLKRLWQGESTRLMCAPMHGRLPRMPLYMPSGITLGWTICTCAWRLRQESNSLSKIT